MDSLRQIESFKKGDLDLGQSGLRVESLGQTDSPQQAWSWLPAKGEGVVVLADRIVRYSSDKSSPLLLEAEVVEGDTTVVIRSTGAGWAGWSWVESSGQTHRTADYRFLSSESDQSKECHRYRQYWTQDEDEGVPVWRPVGARFLGFGEEE